MPKDNYRFRVRLPDGYRELSDLPLYHYTNAPNLYEAFRNIIHRISEQRVSQGSTPVYYIHKQLTHSQIEQLVDRVDDQQNIDKKSRERTSQEVVIEMPWDFIQKNSGRPDYINDPIKKVEEWVNGLPISEEDKQPLMDIIRQERAKVTRPQQLNLFD